MLTDNNSLGVPHFASNGLELTYFPTAHFFDGFENHNGSGVGVATDFAQVTPPASYPLTLHIGRPTASSVTFSVFNSSHVLLGTKTAALSVSFPANLYVSLYSYDISTTFDNVRLAGNFTVPEPASAVTTLVLIPLAMRSRRKAASPRV
jgi:hypothetical protein